MDRTYSVDVFHILQFLFCFCFIPSCLFRHTFTLAHMLFLGVAINSGRIYHPSSPGGLKVF